MEQRERNIQIAMTILNQLGTKALWLIGTKETVAIQNGVKIKFTGTREYNYLRIVLTPMDEYEMYFEKWHGGRLIRSVVKEHLFFDQLRETITEVTGLTTTIPRMVSKNF